ncbi:MAG: HvfX family Cu-binding RiPP maturation protein [Candidatus Eutrophobiaceae bacterium]
MPSPIGIAKCTDQVFAKMRSPFDFLPLLLLRIYLAPIFIKAGYGKLQLGSSEDLGWLERLGPNPNVVQYFGNPEWGLGMPMPELMTFLAGWTEFLGGWFLLVGLLTRYVALPLMFTMIVAAATAHWSNGWHALPEMQIQMPWEWKSADIQRALERKDRIVGLLKEHGNYSYFSEYGNVTILRNGIEFAATYFLMIMVLCFFGAGRFMSLDYWFARFFRKTST